MATSFAALETSEFATRWAKENLTRDPTQDEVKLLNRFLKVCNYDVEAASKRARCYYTMRGRRAVRGIWHNRKPDDEDILRSCQEAYIIPLKSRSVGGRRLTIARMPAPHCLDQPLAIRALVARRLDADDVTEEVTVIDLEDLQSKHYRKHFQGNYWRDFFKYIMEASPLKFAEIHVVNTGKLTAFPLFMLKMGAYPWKQKVTKIHDSLDAINQIMGVDYFPIEGLPHEYGGKAGHMKDLNDACTKNLLTHTEWLRNEENLFKNTEILAHKRTHYLNVDFPKFKRNVYNFVGRERELEELSGCYKHLNITYY